MCLLRFNPYCGDSLFLPVEPQFYSSRVLFFYFCLLMGSFIILFTSAFKFRLIVSITNLMLSQTFYFCIFNCFWHFCWAQNNWVLEMDQESFPCAPHFPVLRQPLSVRRQLCAESSLAHGTLDFYRAQVSHCFVFIILTSLY